MITHEFADAPSCARALAGALGRAICAALDTKPRATLALSGGRSPETVLPMLAAQDVDWACVDVTLIDDRCVAEDDPASNAGLVRRCFLQAGAAAANFVPLWTEPFSCTDMALRLVPILPIDIAYLGMGTDGHFASLFPSMDVAAFESDIAPAILSEAPTSPRQRISLTLSTLLASRHPFLHVTGTDKRHVLIEAGDNPPTAAVPVSLLVHARPDLQVFACD